MSTLPLARVQAFARACTAPLVLLIVCAVLFFQGLNTGDLYRTEGLRAIVAAEFLRSGDWLVPRLYDEPLLTKPPVSYAAIALASWPAGSVRESTARLPSALAATFTVFLFYWYFQRQLGRSAGLIAALLLPMSVVWLDKVPTAEIDMLQVAWVAAAILFFLRGLEVVDTSGSLPWWVASLLCVAGGLLTKWTAPAFFYGTVVPLLWWRGRLRLLLGRTHLAAAGLAALVCLGWVGIVLATAGWESFASTVGREALMRLLPTHHDRAYPWRESLTHPVRILLSALPWSAVALLTLRPSFADLWDERGRLLLQALHCWVWPNLLFWSVIPEHAVRHSFPLFPGIAGLAGMVWIAWLSGRLRWPVSRVTARRVLIASVMAWLIGKTVFAQAIVPPRNQVRKTRSRGERLASLVPPGETLYLFRPRDEALQCILFYYSQAHLPPAGPPIRRVPTPSDLPSSGELLFCIVERQAWEQWPAARRPLPLVSFEDEHGAAVLLVRLPKADPGVAE